MRCILPLVAFTLLLAVAGCVSPGGTDARSSSFPHDAFYAAPEVPRRTAAEDSSWLDTHEALVARQVAAAPVVCVARVIHVGRSPGIYSGIVVVRQSVLYEIEEVWKGRAPAKRVVVTHILDEYPTVDAGAPRLNPEVWREGARLVIVGAFLPPAGAEFAQCEAAIHPVLADGAAAERVRRLVE